MAKAVLIEFQQKRDEDLDHDPLVLRLPRKAPDRHIAVVVLELDGSPEVDPLPLRQQMEVSLL